MKYTKIYYVFLIVWEPSTRLSSNTFFYNDFGPRFNSMQCTTNQIHQLC